MNNNQLKNQYLLATPSIKDPLFASSLVYVCEHNEEGCMGVVINHLSDQTLQTLFQSLEIECPHPHIQQLPVFIGGPVNLQQGFVLHTAEAEWERTLKVSDEISLTSSKDILQDIAQDNGPAQFLVMLGFSGWSGGQLEEELQHNSWLTAPSSLEITFHPDIDHKWQMAFDTLGFDLDTLSPTTGNA